MNGLRGSNGCDVKYPASAHIQADDENDKLYEAKPDKKIYRVITVIGYIFAVSLGAILLSLYYIFFWNPYTNKPPYAAKTSMNVTDCIGAPTSGCNCSTSTTTVEPPRLQALQEQMEHDLTKSQLEIDYPVTLVIQGKVTVIPIAKRPWEELSFYFLRLFRGIYVLNIDQSISKIRFMHFYRLLPRANVSTLVVTLSVL